MRRPRLPSARPATAWTRLLVSTLSLVPGAGTLHAAPAAQTPGAPPAKPDLPPAPTLNVAAGGILGRTVIDPGGQAIGRVVDVLVDPGGNPRAAVIDFGGFLGVGSRRIAVNWSDLNFPPVSATSAPGNIKLDLTAEQIMSAPEYTDQTKPAAVVQPPPSPR